MKNELLKIHFPDILRSSVHCGYHRGRRHLIGPIILPDIVSIHHLHLHIIVEPTTALRVFKYPAWFPVMWKSEEKVMAEIEGRRVPKMKAKA